MTDDAFEQIKGGGLRKQRKQLNNIPAEGSCILPRPSAGPAPQCEAQVRAARQNSLAIFAVLSLIFETGL